MLRRLPTTHLPLLALVVVALLFGHDLGMAAELHHPEVHDSSESHGSRQPSHHLDRSQQAPTDVEMRCVSFEAARTTELAPDFPVADIASPLDAVPVEAETAPSTGGVDPGVSRGQLRALLQVWLN